MRTCGEYELLISEFIDGALDEADRAELMAHMAECPICQAYFDNQIAIHDALTQLEEVPVPADLASQVMARVRETPQDRPTQAKTVSFPHWRRWAAMAACCAIAVLGAWGLRDTDTTPPAAGRAATRSAAADGPLPAYTAEPEAPAAAPAEEGISPQQEDAPAGSAKDALLPSLASMPADTADSAKVRGQLYAGVLSTASPTAKAWVEEHLGLAWVSGGSYELTEEEYAALLEILLEAEEPFDETPGGADDGGYLLLAE